jgi:hypothetical protein
MNAATASAQYIRRCNQQAIDLKNAISSTGHLCNQVWTRDI